MWTLYNGGTLLTANFKSLTQELNGPEELTFTLPNTAGNRTFVASDRAITLYPPYYDPTLIMYLPMNEGAGATAYDSSGNGNNGAITGASWVDGKYGKCLSFDGTDDYVDTFNPQFLAANFTITCWFRNDDTDHTQNREIFTQRENPDLTVDAIALQHGTDHKLVLHAMNNGVQVFNATISNTVSHGEWHQVVVGRNGGSLFIFVDGVNVTSGSSVTGDLPVFASNLFIGLTTSYWAFSWEGLIDDFRVYNRALSQAEVSALYFGTNVFYGSTSVFNGVLKRPKYSASILTCTVYNEALEQMKRRTHTATYVNAAANAIFGSVCTAAGVTAGSCPTTALSVRFEDAYCYDITKYMANVLAKDFWVLGGTANIATKGTQRTLTNYNVSERTLDRSKNIDKVKVIGYDSVGNYITGEAGAGNNIKVYRESSASGTATLGSLAAKYLSDLNTDSKGAVVTALPSEAAMFDSGDTVVLNKPKMNLAGTFKIYKLEKSPTKVKLEVDMLKPTLELTLDDMKSYERLGIISLGEVAAGAASDAQVAADAAQIAADNAQIAANNAQGTANTAITNAANAQGTANTALANAGAAQSTADGKNTVYYQAAEPSGGTYKVNDVWFDSDNSYKMYKYGGAAWVGVEFGTNAIENLAITNAKIADATIESAKIVSLDCGKITTGSLSAVITTSGTIQTAASGDRAVLNNSGLHIYGDACYVQKTDGTGVGVIYYNGDALSIVAQNPYKLSFTCGSLTMNGSLGVTQDVAYTYEANNYVLHFLKGIYIGNSVA